MTVTGDKLENLRRCASFACEFCGVSETDAGGLLTVDHFQPKAKGGPDDPDNLLYCCARCNSYKVDYWPEHPDDPMLWNPRREPATRHFLELDNGRLHPLTGTGAFTLLRLRLNRQPLIAHRRRKREAAEIARSVILYRNLLGLIVQLLSQQAALMEDQQRLLKEQQELLQRLSSSQD
jgi:HNH endonuclease